MRKVGLNVGLLGAILLFIAAEVALVKLALWQYARAGEKMVLRAEILEAQETPASWPLDKADVGREVTLNGVFLPEPVYLLEHQPRQSGAGVRTGWRVLSALHLADDAPEPDAQRVIWVDRGWTPYLRGQERLTPNLSQYAPPAGEILVRGVVREFPVRQQKSWGGPVVAADPNVLVFLDENYIEAKITTVPRFYVQSVVATGDNIAAILPPLPAPGRHREYMFTWLGLALILPFLFGGLMWRRWQKR